MRQHHPLENPSLTPYGFVTPIGQRRLEYTPTISGSINAEKIVARIWDRWNRANAPKPLPVQTIIHEILPGLATVNRIIDGDFWHDGLPYLTRDILVLSRTVQWLGSNNGRCFLETDISRDSIPEFHPEREFRIKFAKEMRQMDMVAMLMHICTPRCEVVRSLYHSGCYYYANDVSSRDRAVVDGLMRWLGKKAGRAFIAEFKTRKKSAWDAANKRETEKWKAKGWITTSAS